jgi:hypothetical protein
VKEEKRKMASVYVVQKGEHSDRHIVGVFTKEERAKQYSARFRSDHRFDVEEWELDIEDKAVPEDVNVYYIGMLLDTGDVIEAFQEELDQYPRTKQDPRIIYNWIQNEFSCYYLARDEKHAIKIANERLARWKAEHPNWEQDAVEEIKDGLVRVLDMVFNRIRAFHAGDAPKYYADYLKEPPKILKRMYKLQELGHDMREHFRRYDTTIGCYYPRKDYEAE